MKEKTPQEQTAAARQTDLLYSALETAATSDGYWLNVKGRMMPRIHGHAGMTSPFNALMFALHADAQGYRTAVYTSFGDARKRCEAVLKDERSVPMNWYRWTRYVNRHDDKDVIGKEQYQALPPDQQNMYKAVRQREIRSMFNIEQTTLPMSDAKAFDDLCQRYGGVTDRGNLRSEERQLRSAVSQFRRQIEENLVPIRKSTDGSAAYDSAKDVILMPAQKHYEHYDDYVRDLVRQTIAATGYRERMAREGRVAEGGRMPSGYVLDDERLVTELATGVKLMQMGLPAKLSPESLPLIERWQQGLRENPCMIDVIETDMNNALDMIEKAERGEKQTLAEERNRQKTEELREKNGKRPQVSAAEALVLQDIIRHGGMGVNERNFPGGREEKYAFMEKFSNLRYYDDQYNAEIWQAQERQTAPELINVAYTAASGEAVRIQENCLEWLPREWEEKGTHFVADELDGVPDKKGKEFVVVSDKRTGIADVILPAAAMSGGNVVMPNGDRRNYWLTPNEVMLLEERKEAGAKVVTGNLPGFNKERIEKALMEHGASYVRFFNKNGLLRYHPDDAYFAGKEVKAARLNGRGLEYTSTFDISEAVKRATEVQFERVQMLRDDDGRWTLYLKAKDMDGFGIHPDKEDTNRFFSTVKQADHEAANAVRNELAQKYHAMAEANPELKVDIFGKMPEGIDPLRIQRVNIFKNKDEQMMILAKIEGVDKLQPRQISREQWQRLWVADDVSQYKTVLAANVFADVLRQQKQQDVVDRQQSEEVATARPNVATDFPNLKQYDDLKSKHPDALLLFRIGDNYEAYQQDARKVGKVLGLETAEIKHPAKDNTKAEVTRFHYGELDSYLPKLIRAGERVAICDQLEPRKEVAQQEKQEEQRSSGMRR